jgi:plastocyanin
MSKIGLVLGVLFLIGAVATGCGSSSAPSASSSSPPAAMTGKPAAPASSGPTIAISGMAFGEPVTVSPGAQVAITNGDGVEHSVTSKTAGQFDTEVDANEQKTFTAPTQPGEYPFYCKYHSNMKGTLTVK